LALTADDSVFTTSSRCSTCDASNSVRENLQLTRDQLAWKVTRDGSYEHHQGKAAPLPLAGSRSHIAHPSSECAELPPRAHAAVEIAELSPPTFRAFRRELSSVWQTVSYPRTACKVLEQLSGVTRRRAPNLTLSDRLLCRAWTCGPRKLMKTRGDRLSTLRSRVALPRSWPDSNARHRPPPLDAPGVSAGVQECRRKSDTASGGSFGPGHDMPQGSHCIL
jgi:hypothetical protein